MSAALLLHLPLAAQDFRNGFVSLQMTDNTVWCATNNCLTALGGTMAEIKSGSDGTLYGLTSASALYTFTVAAGWVEAPSALQTAGGKSLTHISVGMASAVLALSSAASPANNVFVLNSGGTGWTALSRRLSVAEIGSDGSIWGIDSSGYVWCYINGVWSDPAGAGEVNNVAVSAAQNAIGVSSSGGLMQWNGSAFAAFSPAPNFIPSQAKDAVAMVGDSFVAALDASGGIHVLVNTAPTQPQAIAVGTVTCVFSNGYVCTATVPSVAGIQIGDNISIAGNILGGGSLTVYSTTACSPAPCVEYYGANSGGPYSGGTLTDNTAGSAGSNWGKWSAIQGTASALTGGGAYTFALSGGGTYHLNLTIPTLTVTATSAHGCSGRGGCISETLSAQAYFTNPPGAHGAAGITVSRTEWEPNTIEVTAVEPNPYCDPINHNGGCSPYYDACANCLGGCTGPIGITAQTETAVTLIKWLGTSYNCSTSRQTGLTYCDFGVQDWCTAQTTPPDNSFNGALIKDLLLEPPIQFWTAYAGCIRFAVNGVYGPWECFTPILAETSFATNVPLGNCTHNP